MLKELVETGQNRIKMANPWFSFNWWFNVWLWPLFFRDM